MRIRKRFRLSSRSSLPLLDPQLNRSPVVQQPIHGGTGYSREGNTDPQPSDPPNQRPPPPSVQPPTIGPRTPRWGKPNNIHDQDEKLKELESEEVKEDDRWRDRQEKSNDIIRKGIIFGAEAVSELQPSSSASCEQDGRWGEEDRAIPLKKRKGNFQIITHVDGYDDDPPENISMVKEKKMNELGKIKTSKRNKKITQQLKNGNSDEQDGSKDQTGDANHNMISTDVRGTCVRKPKKRGNMIMEGSQCSRVNGRGWRCFQQTLVGYSLCEHHLGKGRLRSMTSVRHAHKLSNTSPLQQEKETFLHDDDDNDDEDADQDENDHEKQLSTVKDKKKMKKKKKKMMKLGKVKARSISSLLGQTADNNAVLAVIADHGNENAGL